MDFPLGQTCCGQMHVNTGYQREAAPLVRRFAEVFAPYDTVVSPSGSCVGSVRHRVTYHPTRHGLGVAHVGDRPLRLLREVRGIDLVELPLAEQCCGFGGGRRWGTGGGGGGARHP